MSHQAIRDIGSITSYDHRENQITGTTEAGSFRISAWSDHIFRVQVANGEGYETNPYSVTEDRSIPFECVELGDSLRLNLAHVTLQLQKNPFRITFYSSDGEMLSTDDNGLGISIQGTQMAMYRTLQEGERFLGMGEKTGHIDRRGAGFVNWNTDRFAYSVDADPLYASIPFFIGMHHGLVYGLFMDNSYRSEFNFGASNDRFSSISVEGGDLDYYFISGDSIQSIISSYSELTGKMPFPPVWSVGYQQCRYSYYPQNEVKRLGEKFRDKKIPADVIVLDIHYMEKFKIFSWDGEKFPNPDALIQSLKDKGFEVVLICDPGIKIEEGYETYDAGIKDDVFIKYPDGSNYTAEVWPGWCHFPDFTADKARSWWKEQMKSYTEKGVKGYWNDMNEIASWGNMMPDNILFDMDGESATTRKARNVYGFQMARASYESTRSLIKERPFILTRAGFAGVQRYSALWTGDNVSTDDHLMLAVRMILNLGMSGVPFSGSDIGGFVENTSGRLFARWIQVAAFAPFFRAHTMLNSHSAEPWSFGEEVEEIATNFIRLRYKLLPYLYQAFRKASHDGTPVMKSLALDYTWDDRVYDHAFENQFLFGDSMLVAPLKSSEDIKKVFLPQGQWYELFSGDFNEGNRTFYHECGIQFLPVYVKASSIIPMYPQIGQHTRDIGTVLELHVYHGSDKCTMDYYEDDGISYDFEDGGYHLRSVAYDPEIGKISIGESSGEYVSRIKTLRVLIHGLEVSDIKVDKKSLEIAHMDFEFARHITGFDPFYNPDDSNHPRNRNLPFVELEYSSEQMTIDLK